MAWLSLLFNPEQKLLADARTVLDAVTALASLASRQIDIDELLDVFRRITAEIKPGDQPTPEAAEQLWSVYLKIEHYLITSDPIRTFQQDELRARLAKDLRQQLETYEIKQKGAGA